MPKSYQLDLIVGAALTSSFGASFASANREVVKMQNQLRDFNKVQSDISAFQKQQSAAEGSKVKLAALQQQYDNIQRELQETGNDSSLLQNKLIDKEMQINKVTASLSNQTAKLNEMSAALRNSGINTNDLAGGTQRLETEIRELTQQQEAAALKADKYAQAQARAAEAVQLVAMVAPVAMAVKETAGYMLECADASMEFESALAGVAKTTDLTDIELKAMSAEIKALSTEIPVLSTDLLAVGETAGQLGIQKGNLVDFTQTMSMLSTATTMTADNAATMLAQFANITQMDASYYPNLGSSIVALGNNYATTEQKITDMAQGIAASASLANMSEADMVALSAAVTSLGIETQAGATSMSKLISEIMLAVETGENLEQFSSIANQSATEFTAAWGTDAVGALQAFVTGLNDTERNGMSATAALTELGITETRMQRMVLSLANSGDLLNRTLETSSQAWAENTALTREAEMRYATTESQLILLQNAYGNVQVAIGDALTPIMRELYAAGGDILNDVSQFIAENPQLVRAIAAVAGGLGVGVAVVLAYAAALKIAAAAQTLFNTSMPHIMLVAGIIAGITALAGALVALGSEADEEARQVRELSEASREQYFELQELQAQYEATAASLGETSAEAQLLKKQVDDLTADFEANKQTLKEFIAETDAVFESGMAVIDSYREAVAGIDKQEQGTAALINRLSELAGQNQQTEASQGQMIAIIDLLNQSMEGLGLTYDEVIARGPEFVKSLGSVAEADAAQKRYNESLTAYTQALQNVEPFDQARRERYAQLESAQKRLADQQKKVNDLAAEQDAWGVSGLNLGANDIKELEAAQAAVDELTIAYNEASAAYDENAAVLKENEELYKDVAAAQETNADNTALLTAEIASAVAEMEKLTEAYNESYDAALSSIEGQYGIWDRADKVVATSVKSMNANIETQMKYWQDYNANLEGLTARAGEIAGLREMMASFSDGSSESVNAVAGMNKATDEELAAMVANWQQLQTEQQATAGNLAEIETDYTNAMNAISEELAATVGKMDLSTEAATAGTNTVRGFINSAKDMLGQVYSAYKSVGSTAIKAIQDATKVASPSRIATWLGEMTVGGFNIGGEKEGKKTKQTYGKVADTAIEAMTPTDNKKRRKLFDASEESRGFEFGGYRGLAFAGAGGGLVIQLQPHYQISGPMTNETKTQFDEHDRSLIAAVRGILRNLKDDEKRTRY